MTTDITPTNPPGICKTYRLFNQFTRTRQRPEAFYIPRVPMLSISYHRNNNHPWSKSTERGSSSIVQPLSPTPWNTTNSTNHGKENRSIRQRGTKHCQRLQQKASFLNLWRAGAFRDCYLQSLSLIVRGWSRPRLHVKASQWITKKWNIDLFGCSTWKSGVFQYFQFLSFIFHATYETESHDHDKIHLSACSRELRHLVLRMKCEDGL